MALSEILSGPWENQVLEPSRQSGLAALQMAACLNAERLSSSFKVMQNILPAFVMGISVFTGASLEPEKENHRAQDCLLD